MTGDPMFRTGLDDNGVEVSRNDHSYNPPVSDQRPDYPHYVPGSDGRNGYTAPPVTDIIQRTKDRVIGGQGSRPGAMQFEGDLLSRGQRVPADQASKGVEIHDPSCWCDACSKAKMQAMEQTSGMASTPKVYRK